MLALNLAGNFFLSFFFFLLTYTVATTLVHDVSGGSGFGRGGATSFFWQHHSLAACPPCSPSPPCEVCPRRRHTHRALQGDHRPSVCPFVPVGSWRPNVRNATRRCISVSVIVYFNPSTRSTSLSPPLILCPFSPPNCRHFIYRKLILSNLGLVHQNLKLRNSP